MLSHVGAPVDYRKLPRWLLPAHYACIWCVECVPQVRLDLVAAHIPACFSPHS